MPFDVSGLVVGLAGAHDLVSETLDFTGVLCMDAKISETMTGVKRSVLKMIDPLFRNKRRDDSTIHENYRHAKSGPSFAPQL